MTEEKNSARDASNVDLDQPQLFRRDIDVTRVAINKNDLHRLFEIVSEASETALVLQETYEDPNSYNGEEPMRATLRQIMNLGYSYSTEGNAHAEGHGIPNINHENFPEDLNSIYISTSKIPQQLTGKNPGNYVDLFLDFKKPPLTMNLLHAPSNPTENGSAINVIGRDEAWVISTYDKIMKFFGRRKVNRYGLHSSGTYDAFLFLCFIPIWIWALYRAEQYFFPAGFSASVVLSVAIVLYVFLCSLLLARFLFQYI